MPENTEPISNLSTILDEINDKLEVRKNPSIEYLLVRPFSNFSFLNSGVDYISETGEFGYFYDTDFSGQGIKNLSIDFHGIGINYNTLGHSAVRYTTPDGRDIVVNIQGKEIKNGEKVVMVRFYDAKEYLYGKTREKSGAQAGVYNRDIIGIRVEDVDSEKIRLMHNYFLSLIEDEKIGLVKFNIIFGPFFNLFREIFQLAEYGNCAKWISGGLYRAGVSTSISIFPKSILVDMFENYEKTSAKSKDNIHIVYYQKPTHLYPIYGLNYNYLFEEVAPFQYLRSYLYFDLEKYANVIVTIPKQSKTALVTINNDPIVQSKTRNIVNNSGFIMTSTLLNVWLIYRLTRFVKYQLKTDKYKQFRIKQIKKIDFYQRKIELCQKKLCVRKNIIQKSLNNVFGILSFVKKIIK